MKLLLIDDNQKFGELLMEKFNPAVTIEHCLTIDSAINCNFSPDVILLDVNLGSRKAHNYMVSLSSRYQVPILAISSELERRTKVLMLEQGVVDYIEKPIDFELLNLKLDNIISVKTANISFAKLELNIANLTLNDKIRLSKNEFIVLKYFIENSESLIPKRDLLRLLWENEQFVEEAALITLISRLRKKLVQIDDQVEIKTIRNQGVRLGLKC